MRGWAGMATDSQGQKVPEISGFIGAIGRLRIAGINKLAETEGFEPSVPYSQYDGLANRWFQPLTHVSAPVLTPLGRCAGIGL
jgi:hypothetical protein